jgi:uncharacterized protein (DUF433 family)
MGRKKHPLIEMRAGAAKIPHPCIVNTRMRVSYLVDLYLQYLETGLTDDQAFKQVCSDYETQYSCEEITAALDYWRDNPDQIEIEIRQDRAMSAALEMQQLTLEMLYSRK